MATKKRDKRVKWDQKRIEKLTNWVQKLSGDPHMTRKLATRFNTTTDSIYKITRRRGLIDTSTPKWVKAESKK